MSPKRVLIVQIINVVLMICMIYEVFFEFNWGLLILSLVVSIAITLPPIKINLNL